jgi:DNA-binding MarR family transcriptional regulator
VSQREEQTDLFFRLFTEINIIGHLSSTMLESVLPEGVSRAQFGVLNHFVRLGGQWAPARLARAFQVTKGAMTNTLQRLEAQGYVRIVADPKDARAKLVEITDAGRKVREQLVRSTGSVIGQLTGLIAPEDVRAALPFLEQLRMTLDKMRD